MRATFIGLLGSFVLLFAVAVFAGDKPKNIYKVFHLSPSEIGISCQNGADPSGRKVGDLVIISCGK
jgi:hypothetical protein